MINTNTRKKTCANNVMKRKKMIPININWIMFFFLLWLEGENENFRVYKVKQKNKIK